MKVVAMSEQLSNVLPNYCMVYLIRVMDLFEKSSGVPIKIVAMSEELSNVLPNDCMVYLRRVMESLLKLWPCRRNYLMFYLMTVWFI